MVNVSIVAATTSQSNVLEQTRKVDAQGVSKVSEVEDNKPKHQEHTEPVQQALIGKNEKVSDEDHKLLTEAIAAANEQLKLKSTALVFEFDEMYSPPIVKVVDKDSGEIIREIPSKELREITKALTNIADNFAESSGILLNEQL